VSASDQLAQWAHTRSQRDDPPRRDWQRYRARSRKRVACEQIDANQLELFGWSRSARGAGRDQGRCGSPAVPPAPTRSRPTPEECRLRPELAFD
jgi:hypothetical protein